MTDIAVYALVDPRDDLIRYVGVTGQFVDARLRTHINSAKTMISSTPKQDWLWKLSREGYKPEIVVLERISVNEWQKAERDWIWYLGEELGFPLTNASLGGGGTVTTRKRRNIGVNVPVWMHDWLYSNNDKSICETVRTALKEYIMRKENITDLSEIM